MYMYEMVTLTPFVTHDVDVECVCVCARAGVVVSLTICISTCMYSTQDHCRPIIEGLCMPSRPLFYSV